MKIEQLTAHPQEKVTMEGADGALTRMLIGPADGASNFHMRHFEVEPGGHTPHHQHDYEHEILVFRGEGTARTEEGDRPLKAGDVIYVPPDAEHVISNHGEDLLGVLFVNVPTGQGLRNLLAANDSLA